MNLPFGFEPFLDLVICGNRFIRGIAPFTISDRPVLLVGKGDLPIVWLVVPSPDAPKKFITLVANNESQHLGVIVETNNETRTVQVIMRGNILISVKKILEEMAAVESMDLRPVGLNIYGNEVSLNVGGMTLVGNRSEGASVLVSLG